MATINAVEIPTMDASKSITFRDLDKYTFFVAPFHDDAHIVRQKIDRPENNSNCLVYRNGTEYDTLDGNVIVRCADDQILAVYDAMCDAPQHTYQLLTKRPERMRDAVEYIHKWSETGHSEELSHIWHGVSAENQECFDERIIHLLDTPSAVRFVSAEPLLGPLNIELDKCYCGLPSSQDCSLYKGKDTWKCPYNIKLDWVIVGGESGPGARPMHPQWVRDIRDQCLAAGVPFFFKQWGQWAPLADHKELRETANKFALVSRDGEVSYSDDGVITAHLDGNDYAAAMVWMRNKHDAGRVLDGRTWDEKPEVK